MDYNFDKVINRKNTSAIKWDNKASKRVFGVESDEALPLWIADMDFKTPKVITDRLKERVEHGIFGYSLPSDDYHQALRYWFSKRYQWTIESDWVITLPGLVPALNYIVKVFTEKGDKVIIQQPVYYPFYNAVVNHDRILVNNPLINEEGHYRMDYDDLETKVKDPQVKLLILCNPHNPVGRVWSKEELKRLGDLCNKYNVLVVSDEIHSDLIAPGHKHINYATISEAHANNCIVCTAPSKTFNLAALNTSNLIIPNKEIRSKLHKVLSELDINQVNIFGITALEAAYTDEGEEWLESLLEYLDGNAKFISQFLKEKLPKVRYVRPEGTYLAWLDFRAYDNDYKVIEHKILKDAQVLLDPGSWFGTDGQGFMRVNFACPRKTLEEALERISNQF